MIDIKRVIENRWYANSPGWLYLFLPLEFMFRFLSALRRKNAQNNQSEKRALNTDTTAPVIVIGNISVGGTGKTPVIIALARHLTGLNLNVGIVSRGYGRQSTTLNIVGKASTPEEVGDEPLEIAEATDCPVIVADKRSDAVEQLMALYAPDVILSDDGLQHYAMHRDIEVVVANSAQGFGNQHCLPVGPLRESVSRLANVDYVLVNKSRYHHLSLTVLEDDKKAVEFTVIPLYWVNVITGEKRALDPFSEKCIRAYAGIGQPQKFFDILHRLNIKAELCARADHATYSASDFSDKEIEVYLMTAKDAVKCKHIAPDNSWYLNVEADIPLPFYSDIEKKLANLTRIK